VSRPDLLTSSEVAHALGYANRSGIHLRIERGDVRLAACRLPGKAHRSWSRARLEAAGYLRAAPAAVAASASPFVPQLARTVAV